MEPVIKYLKEKEEMQLDLLKDSQRLTNLSQVLNLECCAIRCDSNLHQEYRRTEKYVKLQEEICCSYGVDCMSSPAAILRDMSCLLSNFGAHPHAPLAFCYLKAELCYELDRFVAEIFCQIEDRVRREPEKARRLVSTYFKIKNIYPNI